MVCMQINHFCINRKSRGLEKEQEREPVNLYDRHFRETRGLKMRWTTWGGSELPTHRDRQENTWQLFVVM